MNKDLQSSLRLVIIDDSPFDAEIIIRALEKCDVSRNEVIRLKNGEEALNFIFCDETTTEKFSKQVELILLDLKMPKMDGFDVLQIIKANPKTEPIPIVMMTSSTDERDRTKSYQLGVDDFIVKSVEYDQFQKKIIELKYWFKPNVTV